MTETVVVTELEQTIAISFEDLLKYHRPGSPRGVVVVARGGGFGRR
jgi:hypothetical protein